VARRAVWLGGLLPFAQAAAVLQQVGQIAISTDSVWRLSEKWGEQIKAQEATRQEEAKAIASVPRVRGEGEKVPSRLGVAMDGVMVYVRGEGWKELKILQFDPRQAYYGAIMSLRPEAFRPMCRIS